MFMIKKTIVETLKDKFQTIAPHLSEKTQCIWAAIDEKKYDTGRKVTDEEFKSIQIENSEFHGEWNYWIKPRNIS